MKYFRVSFEISLKCNKNCTYCRSHANLPFPPQNKVEQAIENIFLLNKKNINFYFLGGEPTIYPYFFNILEKIYSYRNLNEVLIQSNLSRSYSWFKKLINKFPKIRIAASYHNHQVYNFDDFLQKLLLLKEFEVLEGCDFMLEYENPNKVKECLEKMISKGITPNVRLIEYNSVIKNKLQEVMLLTSYAKYTPLIDKEELDNTSWKGGLCEAGLRGIVIDYNFNVYPCFSAKYSKDLNSNLGNILTDIKNIKKSISKKTRCAWDFCSCTPDKQLKKVLD